MFGSFPVKNRRDAALVDFFKQSGVPESQIVYLQDKQATQQRIDSAFSEQLKKLRPDDLLIVYYCRPRLQVGGRQRCLPRLLRRGR